MYRITGWHARLDKNLQYCICSSTMQCDLNDFQCDKLTQSVAKSPVFPWNWATFILLPQVVFFFCLFFSLQVEARLFAPPERNFVSQFAPEHYWPRFGYDWASFE